MEALIISILSVSLPLIIGGLFSLLLKKKNKNIVSFFVFTSIGTLLFLLIKELIPHLVEEAVFIDNKFGVFYIIGLILLFLGLINIIHIGIDRLFYHHKHHDCHHEHDHGHIDVFLESRKHSFKKAGIALCIALIFHNLPEGMSLGILVKNDLNEGINFGISLFIHNLVMGLTMALPLILSSMKKRNVFLLLGISSLPSIVGALLGSVIVRENEIVNFVMLSFSCSVLIFVVIEEFKSVLNKDFKWYQIFGILLGLLVSFLVSLIHIGH